MLGCFAGTDVHTDLMSLTITRGSRHGDESPSMWPRRLWRVLLLAVSSTLVGCGFGTTPGPPYDFSRLERVVEPILRLSHLSVVDRQENGTDCDGMSCARPRLNYDLRSEPPASFEMVQAVLSAFDDVTKPFTRVEVVQDRDPAAPRHWAFHGEVMHHAVQVFGEVTSDGDVFAPGAGRADLIRVVVWADHLAAP